MSSNLTIAQRYGMALVEAAESKAEALRSRKKAERIFDVALLRADGKNVDERKANARLDPEYVKADDDALDRECAAIVAKAKADTLEIRFEEWRTEQATARAEMKL